MKFFKSKGQITMWLTFAGAVLTALIGGYFSQSSRTDAALDEVKKEQSASVLSVSQRVTATETNIANLQSDVKEIKGDVKEILKRMPK